MAFFLSDPDQFIGNGFKYASTGNYECAYGIQMALTQQKRSMPATRCWTAGAALGSESAASRLRNVSSILALGTLRKGVVLATFDADGRYSRKDHPHAVVFMAFVAGGIEVMHQYQDRVFHTRRFTWTDHNRYFNLNRYHVVEPSGFC